MTVPSSVRCSAAALAATLLLAGCSPESERRPVPEPTAAVGQRQSTAPPGSATRTPPPVPPSSTAAEPSGDLPAPGPVELTTVGDGFDQPVAVIPRPGGSTLLVAEKGGRVWELDPSAGVNPEPFLDLSGIVSTNSERGLLGITFDPNGETFFAHYTDADGTSTLAAWPSTDQLATGDAEVLLTVPQPYANHNGGHIEFGPDGYLYMGLGDGGSADDPLGNGQDPSTLLGTLLRIDPTTPDGYAIPPDNPFADGEGGAPEVWAYGLRNPWRFSFDGDTLWIGDVGQNAVEEIDAVPVTLAGANFGWNALEGDQEFAPPVPEDAVGPVHTYPHSEGISVTGGRVSRGDAAPSLSGWYVFGDFGSGFLRALRATNPSEVADLDVELPGLVSFGVDHDGNLLAVSIQGGIYRLVDA